jgi:hypothetical protein
LRQTFFVTCCLTHFVTRCVKHLLLTSWNSQQGEEGYV